MPQRNLPHGDGKKTFTVLPLHIGRSTMVQLTNAFGDKHSGEIPIAHLLDGRVK
jgi:hypothetical protein